ncbi:MAG: hypothetical protein Aureis2KO_22280 [Aureisphaera sp.]
MKLLTTIVFLLFTLPNLGQQVKTPKNLKRAVVYLNKHTSDSIKNAIKYSANDTIKKCSYPWGGQFKTIYHWTSSDNFGSKINSYLKEKGITNHKTEVILIAFKEYLTNGTYNEEKIFAPFQRIERKWKEEDKVRFVTDSLRGYYIPKNLQDAISVLDRMYSDSLKLEITKLTEKDYVYGNYRFGMGLFMRNNWQLWGGSRLSHFFRENKIGHPESMSVVILESFYRYLKGEDMRFQEQISDYVAWEKNRELENRIREKEAEEEKLENFNEYNVGSIVDYVFNYDFASKKQEDHYYNDTCLVKGRIVEKDAENLKIKVELLEGCDRKGIVIYNNDNISYYDIEDKTWSRPKKRVVTYLRKGKSAWFEVDDWETEY